MSQSQTDTPSAVIKPFGRQVLIYFILFFGVIFVLNGIFVTLALKTYTGVVTDHAYKKGLAYDTELSAAKAQPKLKEKFIFKDGVLRWTLLDQTNKPLEVAHVRVTLFRPVQEGVDFDIELKHQGKGIYSAPLHLPLKGLWKAKLTCQWDNKTYKRTHSFLAH